MPLEKKARVPVRRHVSSFARIFLAMIFFFIFFFLLLPSPRAHHKSQNFDKKEENKNVFKRRKRIFV